MPYSTTDIANYFIEKSISGSKDLTPMKLQKLVYFAHGWHLALTGKPLIDELVEAWNYGPVAPSLYHECKIYGSGIISDKITDPLADFLPRNPQPISDVAPFLDKVIEVYWKYDALTLSAMSHEAGGPWDQIRKQNPNVRNADISNELIQQYFKSKIKS